MRGRKKRLRRIYEEDEERTRRRRRMREERCARGASSLLYGPPLHCANRMQDKTVGLASTIHDIPISRDTTDAHAGTQSLDFPA